MRKYDNLIYILAIKGKLDIKLFEQIIKEKRKAA